MEVEVFLGRVLHVIDPDNFWMHIGTNDHFAEFLQFEVNLEDFCRLSGNYIDDINEIYAGQFVLVDCTDEGGTWKRGQVSRVDSIQRCADVVYIDYGSTELVEESRLCANIPDEYLQFPFQALCCKLAGIQPIARSWTSRAVKMFQDMTNDQVFHTILLPSGPGWFKVVLYRQDGDERSIAHEMLAQELALPSGDAITEYFMDASEFYKQNLQVPCTEETSGWPLEANIQEQYGDDDENNDFFGNDEDGADGLEESSPEIIPSFNFLQLHHTKEADTEKFQEKKAQQNRQELEKENEKIQEDFKMFANQASMAGYGGLDDLGGKGFSNNNNIVLKVDSEPPPPLTPPAPIVISDQLSADSPEFIPKSMSQQKEVVPKDGPQMPLKRYSMMRARDKANKMSLEDRLELCNVSVTRGPSKSGNKEVIGQEFSTETMSISNGPLESESTADPTESESSIATSLSSPSNKQRESSPSIDKRLVGSPIEFRRRTKGRGRGRGSPRGSFSKDSDKMSEGNSSPLTVSSQETFEDAVEEKPKIKVTSLWRKNELGETSRVDGGRKDLPDFCQTLHKIFADSDKESSDLTRAKLQSLFQTDLYLFLNKEQMNDVIFVLLNRAIRYYGEFHDILLEKIDTLQVTEDFAECFTQTLKTMEETYIKVQTRGKPFHVQCSKLIGHIFNMSLHWDCRNVVHDQIGASLDKWILFNKKAQQIGQDLLQTIYLECFENVWDIVRVTFSGLYPERKICIQKECRDKILNGDITRKVRSQMLDIYVSKLLVPVDTVKMDAETQTELSSPRSVTKGTQTETAKSLVEREPRKLKPKSSHKNDAKDQKEWPSLGQPKVPEWTNKILESCTSKVWNPKDETKLLGRTNEILRAPDSFSNGSSSNFSGISSAFSASSEDKSQSGSVYTTASSRTHDSRGRKSADVLKTFNVKSPRKASPKAHASKSDTVSNTSWSSDVILTHKPVISSTSVQSFGPNSKKGNENLSNSSLEFPPMPSVSKTLPLFDTSAKSSKGSRDSFFPSAHIENEIPKRSKSSPEKSLQDIGASLLSSTSQTSQSSKQREVGPSRSPSQKLKENQSSSRGIFKETESAKEKSFDWFDMEEEEEVPSHSSNQNYASTSTFSNDKDLEARLSGDKDSDINYVEERDNNQEEDQTKTDSNSSAKVSDEVPKKDSYDWFDLAPTDGSQDTSQNVKTSETHTSNGSPNKVDAKKTIDWFDGGDNDEDTGNDAEWYTDDSSDDDDDIQDVVSIPRKQYLESNNEDDSESTDSFKTSARYNFPKNEPPRWVPGKRKCTICGEESHIIYECPERNKKGFFF